MTGQSLPYRISTLIFLQDKDERLLLIKRRKAPNKGCWSPPGGKLEMDRGESPYECAVRETKEEVGLSVHTRDLHLFACIAEKNFEGNGHWLMFLFRVLPRIQALPAAIAEGHFDFFSREEIDSIEVPSSDRKLVWPYWDSHRDHFVAIKADCHPQRDLELEIEESFTLNQSNINMHRATEPFSPR